MRHRYLGNACTGLGNPDPALLTNALTSNPAFNAVCQEVFADAVDVFFGEYGGLDFEAYVGENGFTLQMGIEPAYKNERLLIVSISSEKGDSFLQRGIARGFYGSGILSTTKYRKDYKRHSPFTGFVDKWHPLLMDALKGEEHG